jgi:sialidase-1
MSMLEPFLVKKSLFEARQGGLATCRIPGIVVITQGTVLAYCEGRKSAQGDWGAIDILLRRSVDGGHIWSAPRQPPRPQRWGGVVA